MNLKISIIVLNFNNGGNIRKCISSVLNQEAYCDYEVIIVDAGSTDTSLATIECFHNKRLKILKNSSLHILSPSEGRNKGAQVAEGNILAFLDSDCVPEGDWLRKICDCFENQNISAVFFSRKPDSGRGLGTFYRRYYTVIYSRKFRHKDKLYLSKANIKRGDPFLMLAASNFAIKKAAWFSIGTMDTKFCDPAGEDVMFELKLLEGGHIILFDPNNPVEHNHPISIRRLLKKAFQQGEAISLLRKTYHKDFFKTKHALELRTFLINGLAYWIPILLVLILPLKLTSKIFLLLFIVAIILTKRVVEIRTQLKLVLEIKNQKEYISLKNVSNFCLIFFDWLDFLVKTSKLCGYSFNKIKGV